MMGLPTQKIRLYTFFLVVGFSFSCRSQVDSLSTDYPLDTLTQEKNFTPSLSIDEKIGHFIIDSLIFQKKKRNPKTATILSAILPGAGQVYNRQYYKVHCIYAAFGGVIYALDFNARGFQFYDEAYRARLRGESYPGVPETIPEQTLLSRRNDYRKDKELTYFGLGFIYLLNVAEAFVSAHLSTFDVEDDLISARIKYMDTMAFSGAPFPCVGLTITF